MKYDILNNILDKISKEAPKEFVKYKHTDDNEHNNQVRAKCLIHLFLTVRFGIDDFKLRERYITEGGYDGGIDAYYIDKDNKTVFLIQSKYRTNVNNFENKEISIDEIIKMDIGRILRGEEFDENCNEYNGKIKGLQRKYSELPELGLYNRKVIFLCNLISYSSDQIKRLVDNFEYEIFNFEDTYSKLVFPLLISTYYDANFLDITINLGNKQIPHLRQVISTKNGPFEITVVFVPTYEIAKIMSKYKNALLVFNPRNYLSLDKNPVNQEIRKSILDLDTGEFAIFNNGITIFADASGVSTSSGRQDTGTVTIKKPQIINGGQTAFTLSKLFEDGTLQEKFDNKEVMLKIITPNYSSNESDLEIIKKISKSTNQQSKIEEADMRANDAIQIEIQKVLFERFGLLYERKKGEFEEAIKKKLVNANKLVQRDELIKAYLSLKGEPGQAKNSKKDLLFEEKRFNSILDNIDDIDNIFLSIILYRKISILEKTHKKDFEIRFSKSGYALKYGRNSLIYMYSLIFDNNLEDSAIDNNLKTLLNNWKAFEDSLIKDEKIGGSIFNEYRNSTITEKLFNFHFELKKSIIQN